MTQKELDNFDWNDYLICKSKRYHDQTWRKLVKSGQIPEDPDEEWCLHHIDPTMKYFNLSRYAEWRMEDVVPMTTSMHIKVHKDFEKRNAAYGFLDSLMTEAMNAYCKLNRSH